MKQFSIKYDFSAPQPPYTCSKPGAENYVKYIDFEYVNAGLVYLIIFITVYYVFSMEGLVYWNFTNEITYHKSLGIRIILSFNLASSELSQ